MRSQTLIISLFLALVLLLVGVACDAQEPAIEPSEPGELIVTQSSKPSELSNDELVVERLSSYVVYPTFAEIAAAADIIVIARVKSKLEIVNMARDVSDSTQPDPHYFGIGQVYKLEIDSYLQGTGLETLYYVEYQGFINDSGQPDAADIEREKSQSAGKEYIPLQANQTYLLFLTAIDYYGVGSYDVENFYVRTGHPSQFNLANPNCVRVEDILSEMDLYFPPQPLTKIKDQIAGPDEAKTFPYPYPEGNQECLVTPYP
jgi:hypothetical protein